MLSFARTIVAFTVMVITALPFAHLLPSGSPGVTPDVNFTYLSSHSRLHPDFGLWPANSPQKRQAAPVLHPQAHRVASVPRSAYVPQPVPWRPAPRPTWTPPRPAIVIGSYQQSLINADRASAGLPALSWSGCLASIAYQSAARMARQGYISHAGAVYQAFGCGLGSAQTGENVGFWSAGINDPQLNSMFMASGEHRANIWGPYRYVGTAWVVARNGYAYISVVFG